MTPDPQIRQRGWVGWFGLAGITLPPIGIFLNTRLVRGTRTWNAVVEHEMVHWQQAMRYGWFGFYLRYLWGWIRAGFRYADNPMEREARGE